MDVDFLLQQRDNALGYCLIIKKQVSQLIALFC